MLTEGLQHTSTISVSDNNTALTMGSGDMSVLATPALVALMENAAMLTVSTKLPEASTTVGGFIELSHLALLSLELLLLRQQLLQKLKDENLHLQSRLLKEKKL